jgi:chorismate-pyruvate lyase
VSGVHAAGDPVTRRAARLAGLFFGDLSDLGSIAPLSPEAVPEPSRRLLDHRSHMTVTMERHVGGPVSVDVLREVRLTGERNDYAREILLRDPSGRVVQYGLVRIDLGALPEAVRGRIEAGAAPLGRILIEAGTLMEIHDVGLFAIEPAQRLRSVAGIEPAHRQYGRVAAIALSSPSPDADEASGTTIVELLEIPIL